MSTKKILMAGSNYWTSCFQVGSHHLAREFAKLGYEVAYISDPISPLHFIGGQGLKHRLEIYRSGGLQEPHIWSYVPFTLFPPNRKPILRSEWVHRHWHEWTFPNVVKKTIQNGFGEVDLLYFDTPIQSFWFDAIRSKKKVFRMADNNASFKKSTPAAQKMERELMQKVDFVVCSAKNLSDLAKPHATKVEYLPNGVPLDHFAKMESFPEEYRSIPGPIALYVGALEYWVDYKLIQTLAAEMPNVSFVLIGPTKENPFHGMKNIHLLGPKAYSDIPDYMKHASVGIIPFNVEEYPELIHNVNPLKLLEYMASGIPVVSSSWHEIEYLQSPAFLCKSAADFKKHLQEALDHPKPKEFYRNYAKLNDWSIRAKKILELAL